MKLMAFALTLSLLASPPEQSQRASEYEAALVTLDRASTDASNSVDIDVLHPLAEATKAMESFDDELAASAAGRAVLIRARLNLARGYIQAGARPRAEELIDEVIRSFSPDEVAVETFGPQMEEIYAVRLTRLEAQNKATIRIVCEGDCTVRIGPRPVEPGDVELYLGSYEVQITPLDGSGPVIARDVVLTRTGQLEYVRPSGPASTEGEAPTPKPDAGLGPLLDDGRGEVTRGSGEAGDATADDGSADSGSSDDESPDEFFPDAPRDRAPGPIDSIDRPRRNKHDRLLPRWAEITGVAGGPVLLGVGTGMVLFHGLCPNGSRDIENCPRIWTSRGGGIIAIAFGGAALVTSIALLVVDERRAKRKQARRITPDGVIHF